MPPTVQRMWSTTARAVRTTPFEVLIALTLAVCLSLLTEQFGSADAVIPVIVAAVLALPAALAASAACSLGIFDGRTRWLLTGIFAIASAAYSALLFDPSVTTEWWRAGFLLTGSVSLLTLVPLAARLSHSTASERFWRFNLVLGARTAGEHMPALKEGTVLHRGRLVHEETAAALDKEVEIRD